MKYKCPKCGRIINKPNCKKEFIIEDYCTVNGDDFYDVECLAVKENKKIRSKL